MKITVKPSSKTSAKPSFKFIITHFQNEETFLHFLFFFSFLNRNAAIVFCLQHTSINSYVAFCECFQNLIHYSPTLLLNQYSFFLKSARKCMEIILSWKTFLVFWSVSWVTNFPILLKLFCIFRPFFEFFKFESLCFEFFSVRIITHLIFQAFSLFSIHSLL